MEKAQPCNPSPCGANAICTERSGAGSCKCIPEYFGDPYTGCRPECVQNSDCDRSKACRNNKCQDPCPGVCGLNAECRVQNHSPVCLCLIGYEGDPSRSCQRVEIGKFQCNWVNFSCVLLVSYFYHFHFFLLIFVKKLHDHEQTHVDLHLVVQIVNAEKLMSRLFVHV